MHVITYMSSTDKVVFNTKPWHDSAVKTSFLKQHQLIGHYGVLGVADCNCAFMRHHQQ